MQGSFRNLEHKESKKRGRDQFPSKGVVGSKCLTNKNPLDQKLRKKGTAAGWRKGRCMLPYVKDLKE